jgi:hypothetical protein
MGVRRQIQSATRSEDRTEDIEPRHVPRLPAPSGRLDQGQEPGQPGDGETSGGGGGDLLRCDMPHFWLTYGNANRIISAIILEAPTMLQARMDAAVRGLDRGAPFAEGHHLSADLIASVPSTKIGQMISGAEAAQLLGLLKGRRRPQR